MKFQKGDKVRALTTDPWLTSQFIVGEIYTVESYNPQAFEIYLVEFPGTGSYREDRFELVTTASAIAYNRVIPALPASVTQQIQAHNAQIYKDVANTLYGETPLCPVIQNHKKCECGVDSIGGGKHSSYCPKS